jgi:hypothetical protein
MYFGTLFDLLLEDSVGFDIQFLTTAREKLASVKPSGVMKRLIAGLQPQGVLTAEVGLAKDQHS